MSEVPLQNPEAPERKLTEATREQLSKLRQDVDASPASASQEVQERYRVHKEKMDGLNTKRDLLKERLMQDGFLEYVEKNDTLNNWLLKAEFCVDFERVKKGIDPPTYYSSSDTEEFSKLSDEDPEGFQNGKEFVTIDGKDLPKSIIAIWDDTYDNKRTIDLHVDDEGNPSYRSYRHAWDLEELMRDFDGEYTKVNLPAIIEEEKESEGEKKFDREQDVIVVEQSLEEETSHPPAQWQAEAQEVNALFEEARREFPEELKETIQWVLLNGIEIRAANDGSPLFVIHQEIAPVFRKYYYLLFGKRTGIKYKPLKKYRDGYYTTSLGATKKEEIMSAVKHELDKAERAML